jgi:spermidine/putrescine transport system substrate-binding protein
MLKLIFASILIIHSALGFAQKKLEIAAWGGEIPQSLIRQFEKETGIKVYLSTFESNENLIIKLKSSTNHSYDLITPSGYYVHRLEQFDMLKRINPKRIKNLKQINPIFFSSSHQNIYGIPFVWGATGIFFNDKYINPQPAHWHELWDARYINQLLLLDDTREVFSMSLLSLNKAPNNQNSQDIHQAYLKLLKLAPNIKLFASDAVSRIVSDEDAWVGMAWNGDIVKVQQENQHVHFTYPSEGFIIWEECFAIPKNAKHIHEAYEFINFILQPQHSAQITKEMKFSVTNTEAKKYLPKEMVENPILFPSNDVLAKGILQEDADEKTISLYNSYWELIKISL